MLIGAAAISLLQASCEISHFSYSGGGIRFSTFEKVASGCVGRSRSSETTDEEELETQKDTRDELIDDKCKDPDKAKKFKRDDKLCFICDTK